MNHDHKPTCDHAKLKHCAECDVIECQKCHREWGEKKVTCTGHYWPYYYPIVINRPTYPSTLNPTWYYQMSQRSQTTPIGNSITYTAQSNQLNTSNII